MPVAFSERSASESSPSPLMTSGRPLSRASLPIASRFAAVPQYRSGFASPTTSRAASISAASSVIGIIATLVPSFTLDSSALNLPASPDSHLTAASLISSCWPTLSHESPFMSSIFFAISSSDSVSLSMTPIAAGLMNLFSWR